MIMAFGQTALMRTLVADHPLICTPEVGRCSHPRHQRVRLSAFVHATDAVETCALSAVILGFCPELRMAALSGRNFCISVFNETLTTTGCITCSALGSAVNRHLLRLRLTSAHSSRRLAAFGSTVASVQISQSNSRDLPAYACRIYITAFLASIGL